jgi:monoamine oxidase
MAVEAAIIGAGAAGVAAARTLAAAGRSVVVLEASDRIGGRAWTVEMAGIALDMGAGWLHSADRNPLIGVAETAGFDIDRSASAWASQWRDLGFSREEQGEAAAAWEAFEHRLKTDPPASDRAADALGPDQRWRGYLEALSSYINGALLERLSVADYLAYDNAASDTNWRLPRGYGTLISACLPEVPLHLSCPAEGIHAGGSGVRVDTPHGTIAARAAIVTVSTGVLAQGAIRFDPALDDHLHAAAQLPLGLADKYFLELHGVHGLEPETHVLGNPNSACTGSYYLRPFGRQLVEAFFGGAGAEAIEREGLAAAFATAIDELAGLLGNDIRRHLRPLIGSTWGRMDRVRGSYSHALPGHAPCRAVLGRPLDRRIFFAGEATHATDFSTVHGAWESGVRAAREFMEMAD